MPTWAISRLATFNLTVLVVGIIFVICLYRKRTLGTAVGGIFLASIISGMLILFTQQSRFFLISLACSVLFLHLPLWLLESAVLLWRRYPWPSGVAVLLAFFLTAAGVDAFFIEPTALEVTHHEITDPRIQQPLRIVVIADIQTDQIGEYERKTLETALAQKPDLILFAGDYFAVSYFQNWHDIRDRFQKLVEELDFDAPLGVYAVRGNLDTWLPWPVAFRSMSGKRVNGRTESFELGGIRLTCLSEPDSFETGLHLSQPNEDLFHVVLGHAPNFALGQVEGDLLLAGHTHGGQINFPLIGILSTGCQVPRAWASGMTELPTIPSYPFPRRLIVSRGTGMERGPAPRIRFLCRPELVVIDLKPEKSSSTSEPVAKSND